MTKQALDTLFNCVEFDKYDSDYYQYQLIFNGLVKQYDYRALCKKLQRFVRISTSKEIINKVGYFKNSMLSDNKPKLTEEEYIKIDEQEEQEFINLDILLEDIRQKHNCLKNCVNAPPQRPKKELNLGTLKGTRYEAYAKYTFNYLRQISLERHQSIIHLCEVKGLIYENLLWISK